MPRRRHDGAKSAIGTYDKNLTGQPAPSAPVVTETSFPTLQQGSAKKAAVVSLQHGLRGRGHSVTVDGVFGAGTKAAVIAFQKSRGLTADGIVGAKTWGSLVDPDDRSPR